MVSHRFIFSVPLIMLLVIMNIIRKILLMKSPLGYHLFLMEFKKLLLNYLYVIILEKGSLMEELLDSQLLLEDQDLVIVLVIHIQVFLLNLCQEKIMMSLCLWKSPIHVHL